MNVAVFLGPTLPLEQAQRELSATYYPPAAQGDVYRVAKQRPAAIGIVDGYFDSVPAVWHKEILWAMTQGIAVFGASSIGALRAVELASFGMQGVGEIFEAFASGALQQDDEVAVAHAGAEDGFRALSEAMVNVRATLRAAEAAEIISTRLGAAIERIAKGLHYPDRLWPTILDEASRAELEAGASLDTLAAFVRSEGVDQKRLDALAMLRTVKARFATDPPAPTPVRFRFQHTVAWELLRRGARSVELMPREHIIEGVGVEAWILDELRLQGTYGTARRGALLRALAIGAARDVDDSPPARVVHEAADAFRRERGLLTPRELDNWATEQRVRDLRRFFEDEALVRLSQQMFAADADAVLLDHLRATDQYGSLASRAEAKREYLRSRGLEFVELEDTNLAEAELWQWYFEEQLRRPVPDDIEAWARDAGFSNAQAMMRVVAGEHRFIGAGRTIS